MKVMQVKNYNQIEMLRYGKRWEEWAKNFGYNSHQYPPQQAFFGFYTRGGRFREKGYVAFTEQRAVWRRTKKEALQAIVKRM